MKYFWSVFNILSIGIGVALVGQAVPTLISSSDWLSFGIGVGLLILVIAFIWVRVVDFFEDKK
jgi:hypothetical protein